MIVIVVLGAVGYLVAISDKTQTVHYDCDILGTYKLVIPWFGEPTFYEVVDGELELQPSEITPGTVRFWLTDKDRKDNPAATGGGMVIDRQTLQTGVNQCMTLDIPTVK